MVKVGIAGCGSITIHRHAPEYARNSDACIAGFYDPIRERACALAQQYGGRVYGSYEEMLMDDQIDAVSVCSANVYHASMSIAALRAGKHVLCEKPMAANSREAQSMIAAAAESGKKLMIGHNQRFAPSHRKAKKVLDVGMLGKVISFQTNFSHGGPEAWGIDKGRGTWFFNKDLARLGVLGDLGVHKIDLISWLLEDEISEVCACGGTLDKKDSAGMPIQVEDNVMCIMKTRGGVLGSMAVSWTNYGTEDNSTVIYCTGGVMKINHDIRFPVEVYCNNGDRLYFETEGIQTNQSQNQSGVIDAFVECIVKDTAVPVSAEDAAYVLRVVEAVQQAFSLSVKVQENGSWERSENH